MSDEKEFQRALINAGNYGPLYAEAEIEHPTEPGRILKIDNIGQTGLNHILLFVYFIIVSKTVY